MDDHELKNWERERRGSEGCAHQRLEGREMGGFLRRRQMEKKADSSSTGRWCSSSSPATRRGETNADRRRGSCGGVGLLQEGSSPAKEAAPDGRAPAALRASSSICAVREEEREEEVRVVEGLDSSFYTARKGTGRGAIGRWSFGGGGHHESSVELGWRRQFRKRRRGSGASAPLSIEGRSVEDREWPGVAVWRWKKDLKGGPRCQ